MILENEFEKSVRKQQSYLRRIDLAALETT